MRTSDSLYRKTVAHFVSVITLYTVADKLYGSVYVVLMLQRGLSPIQVGLVLTLSSLALTVFDYPTGNIADSFGRKKTAGLGFLIWGAGLLVYALAHSFVVFVAAMLLWALGIALISGAPTSWFVDELMTLGKSDRRKTLMPTVNSLSLVIGASAGAVSGWLLASGMEWPILISSGIALVTGLAVLLFMKENYGERTSNLTRAVWRNTKEILNDSQMCRLLILTASNRIPFQVFVMSWQIYAIRALNLPVTMLGPILTGMILTLAAGNALAGLTIKRIKPLHVSLIGCTCACVSMLVMAVLPYFWAFGLGVVLFELGVGLHQGASADWVHDMIPSKQRSSFSSALSTAGSTVGLVIPTLSGYLIGRFGFSAAWLVGTAGSCLTLVLLVGLIRQRTVDKGVTTEVTSGQA